MSETENRKLSYVLRIECVSVLVFFSFLQYYSASVNLAIIGNDGMKGGSRGFREGVTRMALEHQITQEQKKKKKLDDCHSAIN